MLKNKPVYLDDVKDAELIKWLKGKGAFSSYIKFKLYELMNNERREIHTGYITQSSSSPSDEKDKKDKKKLEKNSPFAKAVMNTQK